MRILGLDYGDKTIGIAICDEMEICASGVETIFREREESVKKSIERIKNLVKENAVKIIVLGFPKNMDGSLGERCEKTVSFKERLLRNLKNVEIVLWDERLTTVSAKHALCDVKTENQKKFVDKIAAVIILQGYLDYRNKNKEEFKNE